ncbi:transcriptional regulator, LysR family [Gluconacetobacter diazotrophicus PA1 5]|uniref:Putative transcriptional regulator, LysR family n=1 Tax=Gluconacetobacter diazotrophicus (strain ATCC 49037 / DSM 5601 / CCUG 37298 / CIP 103539 / LMG 7603 / PAl5) TaxID=272568 RepID=A9GZP1_GLUDA|nr:LysR family transcriptional regulator [Gluconacetobacter diazotrophicus]ACI51427.1 transcriptional regulator, LysR family [Gluconacetobacter diazotrophicus PA1 5]TWB02464.1 DNA-binding transcriptional LysR family regulator [Gluconacetobacter diazotrophicus]CAP53983.1 putative transcriptional regulator, LysR family [Gluconacetobacter diazotrophicus PA1 5]
MFLRQLTYLIALDQFRHFSRAAESCGVSQPALSAGIRQLENELGVAIIHRNRRFHGLTDEGRRVLVWAKQTLAALDGLRQEAAFARDVCGGSLSIGVMSPALQTVPLLLEIFRDAIPGLHLEVLSGTAADIAHRLREQHLHLGVMYLDQIPADGPFDTLPLYTEQYVLAGSASARMPAGPSCGWADAADLPLCLFSRTMRSRQIVDAGFLEAGVRPSIILETDSISVLHSELRAGRLCSILPVAALPETVGDAGLRTIPIMPCVAPQVGIVKLRQPVMSPVLSRIWDVCGRLQAGDVFAAV